MSAGHGDAIRALIPTATDETLEVLAEVGMNADDVRSDIHRIRTGLSTMADLLALVLDGADADRHDAWHGYATDVAAAAAAKARGLDSMALVRGGK